MPCGSCWRCIAPLPAAAPRATSGGVASVEAEFAAAQPHTQAVISAGSALASRNIVMRLSTSPNRSPALPLPSGNQRSPDLRVYGRPDRPTSAPVSRPLCRIPPEAAWLSGPWVGVALSSAASASGRLIEALDTTTPGDRLVFHIFAALEQFERDLIHDRTRAGLDDAIARGRKSGRPRLVSVEKLARAAAARRRAPHGRRDRAAIEDVAKRALSHARRRKTPTLQASPARRVMPDGSSQNSVNFPDDNARTFRYQGRCMST